MISQNKEEFEYCNIPIWWDKGYTGKGVKIGVFDTGANKDLPFFDGKVFDPLGTEHTDRLNKHGQKVIDVIHQIAPDAEIYMLNPSFSPKPEPKDKRDALKWAIRNNIQLVNMSMKGTNANDIVKLEKQLYNNGTFLVTSAGNEGKIGLGTSAKQKHWFSVGAVHYNDSTGKIIRARYSSYGDEELDIMCFSNIYIHDGKNPQRVFPMEGTSFSSPFVVGMLALYYQYFKETNGRFPTPEETKEFIFKNCIDLEQEGFDVYTGHGLFVLPDELPEGGDKVRRFNKLTIEQVKQLIKNTKRKIIQIHIHHTWKPETKDYQGESTIRAIWEYHTQSRGWSDIGQHFTVAPNGVIWDGRDLEKDPASIKGHNEAALAIEIIGNFDEEQLVSPQREAVVKLVMAIQDVLGLTNEDIIFHREYSSKTCPGMNIDKQEFLGWINAWRKSLEEKRKVEYKTVDVAPFIKDGRTCFSLRHIVESVGGYIEKWDGDTQTAVARIGNKRITVQIGNPTIKIEEV